MTLTTAQQRRHAALLRERDTSPAAQTVADEIEARAELDDALADRPATVAESAQMVEVYPIIGHITREGGNRIKIERPWTEADVSRARSVGVDIAWQWSDDPMSGLEQGQLIRIWIGTRETGPLLQWDHGRGWVILSNQRHYGNNWACGGKWSATDKTRHWELSNALSHIQKPVAEKIQHAIEE